MVGVSGCAGVVGSVGAGVAGSIIFIVPLKIISSCPLYTLYASSFDEIKLPLAS